MASRDPRRRAANGWTAPVRPNPELLTLTGKFQPDVGRPKDALGSGKCMTCSTCVTNAKWEKVFNKNFADPDYYKEGLPTRIGATLGRLP